MWMDDAFCVIAGPCAVESLETCLEVASTLKDICDQLGFVYVFKASFDKANRSSLHSPRGPGITDGMSILAQVHSQLDVRITTDIHEAWQAQVVAPVVDLLQIPAFLCRQTDLLAAAGRTTLPTNIKKGQFMAPWDMLAAVEKVKEAGSETVFVTERGTTFGYNQVVVDMRSLVYLKRAAQRVIFDATHSTQLAPLSTYQGPSEPEYIAPLARAAVAMNIDGVFFETHPNPQIALSDGSRALPLSQVESLLKSLAVVRAATSAYK